MNCQLCQKELEAYSGNNLSPDMKTQVEAHLQTCKECSEILRIQSLADSVIEQEKKLTSNPFLATRIIAEIEKLETPVQTISPLTRVLRPVLLTASLAAAVFFGVIIGSIYQPADTGNRIPLELALIDDARIESVDVLSND